MKSFLKIYIFSVCLLHSVYSAEIKISVYYETLCKDSIRFITTQLYPTYVKFGGFGNEVLEIELVPYGKAETSLDELGKLKFICHHDSIECDGNIMHACAIKYLPKNSLLDFIYCTMKAAAPPLAGPSCARNLSLDFNPIQTCVNSDGPVLHSELGNQTKALKPKLYWVPWIVYNDSEFNENDLQNSQANLLQVVCMKLQTHSQDGHMHKVHKACDEISSNSSTNRGCKQVSTYCVPVLAFVLFYVKQYVVWL